MLGTMVRNYVKGAEQQQLMLDQLPGVEERARARMNADIEAKEKTPFKDIIKEEVTGLNSGISEDAKEQLFGILDHVPIAYSKVPAIFKSVEKKKPGQGGVFSIFVSDLCKGCGECVKECGFCGLWCNGRLFECSPLCGEELWLSRSRLRESVRSVLTPAVAEAIDNLHTDLSAIAFDFFAYDRLHRVDMGADDGKIPIAYSVACFHELGQQVANRGDQVISEAAALPF